MAGVWTAVLWTTDGPRAVFVAPTRSGCLAAAAAFAADRAALVLTPADARRVRLLYALGRHARALADYLRAVGRRWDDEWLDLVAAPPPRARAGRAVRRSPGAPPDVARLEPAR